MNTTADNLNSASVKYGYGNMSSSLSRSACDISKSMPSTPITTTPSNFRYSPNYSLGMSNVCFHLAKLIDNT